jgi:hypothetical protein
MGSPPLRSLAQSEPKAATKLLPVTIEEPEGSMICLEA